MSEVPLEVMIINAETLVMKYSDILTNGNRD